MKEIWLVTLMLAAGCTTITCSSLECTAPHNAKNGDSVSVNYIGSLQDGTVFDTSYEKIAREKGKYDPNRKYEPLTFTLGAGQMIKGFDEGVLGMKEGEEKEVTIPPEKAYGEYDANLVGAVPIKIFEQSGLTPKAGRTIEISGRPARILSFNETSVMLDLNHELAGKTLVFRIRLEKITPQR